MRGGRQGGEGRALTFFMVMFTEFVLTEGLCGNGKMKALEDLKYHEEERY